MKKFLKDESLAGRTLTAVATARYSSLLVMSFEDDTFAVFSSLAGYESGDSEIVRVAELELDQLYEGAELSRLLVSAKVATSAELRAQFLDFVRERERKFAEQNTQREKNEYERLKAKFG